MKSTDCLWPSGIWADGWNERNWVFVGWSPVKGKRMSGRCSRSARQFTCPETDTMSGISSRSYIDAVIVSWIVNWSFCLPLKRYGFQAGCLLSTAGTSANEKLLVLIVEMFE